MVKTITGDYKIKIHVPTEYGPDGAPVKFQEKLIDFTPPWPRIQFIAGLEKILNKQFPKDLESEEFRQQLVEIVSNLFPDVSLKDK